MRALLAAAPCPLTAFITPYTPPTRPTLLSLLIYLPLLPKTIPPHSISFDISTPPHSISFDISTSSSHKYTPTPRTPQAHPLVLAALRPRAHLKPPPDPPGPSTPTAHEPGRPPVPSDPEVPAHLAALRVLAIPLGRFFRCPGDPEVRAVPGPRRFRRRRAGPGVCGCVGGSGVRGEG